MKSILQVLLAFSVLIANAQSPLEREWVATHSLPANIDEVGYKVVTDAWDNVFVLGSSDDEMIIVKSDKHGNELWMERYDYRESDPVDMEVDDQGNVVATGRLINTNSDDIVVLKVDSNGIRLWSTIFNSTGAKDDEPTALTIDPFGDVIVTGFSQTDSTYDRFTTIKYSAAGAQLWQAVYDSAFADRAYDVATDGGGGVYVTGMAHGSSPTGGEVVTIKYSPTGVEQWREFVRVSNNLDAEPVGIVTDANHNVYVTSALYISPSWKIGTFKYNSAGTGQWITVYNSPFGTASRPVDLRISNSNLIVVGEVVVPPVNTDIVTISYSLSGIENWSRKFAGTGIEYDRAYDVTTDIQGNVYTSGMTINASGTEDFTLVKYSNSGNYQWSKVIDGPLNGDDRAYGVATIGDTNVVVTGHIEINSVDIVTQRYSLNGTEMWSQRFRSPGSGGQGQIVETDSLGNVYVGGYMHDTIFPTKKMGVIKYDEDGNVEWKRALYNPNTNSSEPEVIWDIAIDRWLNVYATGRSRTDTSDFMMATHKISKSGSVLWSRYEADSFYYKSYGKNVVVDDAGNVYCLAVFDAYVDIQNFLIKYDSAGTKLFSKEFGYSRFTEGRHKYLEFGHDGNLLLSSREFFQGYQKITKIDLNGQVIWDTTSTLALLGTTGTILQRKLLTDEMGNVYVAGAVSASSISGPRGGIVKCDSNGNIINESVFVYSGYIYDDVSIGPNSNICFTDGYRCSLYDADLNFLWEWTSPIGFYLDDTKCLQTSSGDVLLLGTRQNYGYTIVHINSNGLTMGIEYYGEPANENTLIDAYIDENDFIYLTGESEAPARTWATVKYGFCQNPLPVTADFGVIVGGLTAFITDSSTNATHWFWDFGDGNTQVNQNPSHTYSNDGVYTITQISYNACVSDTIEKQVVIGCPFLPTSDFNYSTTNWTTQFTDLSIDATAWSWTFGDGGVSTDQNPSHTYTSNGNFTVCLMVSNQCGSDPYCETVTINCPLPASGFSHSNLDSTVMFNNNSTDFNSVLWDFGDGTQSTDLNPVHTYPSRDSFFVCLYTFNNCGIDTLCEFLNLVDEPSATAVSIESSRIHIWPNPIQDQLYLSVNPSFENWDLQIYDSQGRQVFMLESIRKREVLIDPHLKRDGIYLVVVSDRKTVATKILLKLESF